MSTYLDALHTNCLKNDPAAKRRVRDGIGLTRPLQAKIFMLVFFGKRAPDNGAESDAVASHDLKVYCDIGNATNLYGVNPAREIRLLRGSICQFHFKDKTDLGEGKVDVRAALRATGDIGFRGAIVLETGSPSNKAGSGLFGNRRYLAGLPLQYAKRSAARRYR